MASALPVLPEAVRTIDLLKGLRTFREDVLKHGRPRQPVKIGLCVSGGPDSMALAHLLSKAKYEQLGFPIEPTALIVNHNVRAGSLEEAQSVGRVLSSLGILPHIESIDWRRMRYESKNFEMLARKLRYRILAKTAHRLGIKHLFLGHHLDDQVETLIIRLLRNQTPSFLALQGMSEASPIPCCDGLHYARSEEVDAGIHSVKDINGLLGRTDSSLSKSMPAATETTMTNIRPLRSGGIQIYRPLLAYPKATLVSICRDNNISYVIDKTNEDRTFTKRNAIRHLRANHCLPKALQTRSLLDLLEASRAAAERIRVRAARIMQSITIIQFLPQSGRLMVNLPGDLRDLLKQDPHAVAHVISTLVRIVSPITEEQGYSLASSGALHQLANILFGELSPPKDNANAFLYGKVVLKILDHEPLRPADKIILHMSRQPLRPEEITRTTSSFALDGSGDSAEGFFSKWLFWDNRFWIRLQVSDKRLLPVLSIRPCLAQDTRLLNASKSTATNAMHELLKAVAPDKTKYTLPILTVSNQLVAFPTLSNMIVFEEPVTTMASKLGATNLFLRWEVDYKALGDQMWNRIYLG